MCTVYIIIPAIFIHSLCIWVFFLQCHWEADDNRSGRVARVNRDKIITLIFPSMANLELAADFKCFWRKPECLDKTHTDFASVQHHNGFEMKQSMSDRFML